MQQPAKGWLVAFLSGGLLLDKWVDLLFVLLFISLGCIVLHQQRWSQGLFVLLGALIPFSSGLLLSQRRYMWILFPAFIQLAH